MRLAWRIAEMIKHAFSISSKTKNFIQTDTANANKLTKNEKNRMTLKNEKKRLMSKNEKNKCG